MSVVTPLAPLATVNMTDSERQGTLVTSRFNPHVRARRDLRRRDALVIPKGAPGQVTAVRGLLAVQYTVVFWPDGMDGAKVVLSRLSRADVEQV